MIAVGVIGVGRIGVLHAELLAGGLIDGAVLAGVYDRDAERAAAVGSRLRAPSLAFGALLNRADAVVVATPSATHAALVESIAISMTPMLVEKPLATTMADHDRLVEVVERNGARCMVGFNRRFDGQHQDVAVAVRSGDIGDLISLRITSRDAEPPSLAFVESSGGMFADMSIHDLDLARWIAGPVETVTAVGSVRTDPDIGALDDIDTATILLRHTSGVVTTIENSRRSPIGYDQRLEATGTLDLACSVNPPERVRSFLDRYAAAFVTELEAFVWYAGSESALRSPCSARAAREAYRLAVAADRSHRLGGRPIEVADVS